MALITLQLFTGETIDTDVSTDFSLKSENPFFSVGVTRLSHTQDFSVPATKSNNLTFNLDNSVIMQGWRLGRGCWLGYSGGEIAGKLFIKDYNKGRYNLLFVWGAEMDDVLTRPISDYTTTGVSLEILPPKPSGVISEFGFANYNEVHYDSSFHDGLSLMPTINLGWLMDSVVASAGYHIVQDGDNLSHVAELQYNPYNYGITLDKVEVSTTYYLYMSHWAARIDASFNYNNYAFFDSNNNPVSPSAAGIAVVTMPLQTNMVGYYPICLCFYATREVRLRIHPDTRVICLAVSGSVVTIEGSNGQFPYIAYDEILTLSAGVMFTFVAASEYDSYTGNISGNSGYTHMIDYICSIEDSMTVANVGDIIMLDSNLPDISLIDMVRYWCLMVSAFFTIDAESKTIEIITHKKVLLNRFSNNIIDIDNGKRVLAEGSLRRYIDGYSQHNYTVCNSAEYVAEINRYRADYPCNNDLLDEDGEFGVIGYNEGNINASGEAVFENVQPISGGGITLKPRLGVFFFNQGGGAGYHLQWVENNFGMHATMSRVTSGAVSVVITIRERLAEYFQHSYDDIYIYGGCMWVAKSYVWKDDATELELVKIDDAIAVGMSSKK